METEIKKCPICGSDLIGMQYFDELGGSNPLYLTCWICNKAWPEEEFK